MRLIHISDLHLGLQYGDFSLVEDQRFILQQIHQKLSALKADVLLIPGDVYHKFAPAPDSFKLWSEFLDSLESLDIKTFVTSGNHDSSERLGLASNYLKYGDIYLHAKYEGELSTYTIEQDGVIVHISLLPFVRPSNVRNYHDDFTSHKYNDAIEYILKDYDSSQEGHHVLLAHQFVIHGEEKPQLSDSEIQPQVGGIDAIHTSLFDGFDYVALGHIHKPQRMGRDTIRYSGSPLKYSKTESQDNKALVVIDIDDTITLSYEPLTPLRDVKVITGTLEEIIAAAPQPVSQDFIHVNLTDAIRPILAMDRLQKVYPNCVDIDFQSTQGTLSKQTQRASNIIELKPLELVDQFYHEVLEKEMSKDTQKIVETVMAQIQERTNETD